MAPSAGPLPGAPRAQTWRCSQEGKRQPTRAQEYYRAIQGALAVLPAFASPVYLTRKASSSVAAAIICGTPLLADPALLQAYSYLPARAVFETAADERLAVAVSRIAAHSSEGARRYLAHHARARPTTPRSQAG